MKRATNFSYTIKPNAVGAVVGVVNTLSLAAQIAQLIEFFQKEKPSATLAIPCESKQLEEEVDLPERHFVTENWVLSPEYETAVLLDIESAKIPAAKALSGLHKLYPRKQDIVGVRMLARGSKMIIVFANTQLQEHALLYGFQMDDQTVLYATKALDNQFKHTLLTIEGLTMNDAAATKQKLESSLKACFTRTVVPQHGEEREANDPWPPTFHDVFFHQSTAGFYSGKVTVICRGTVNWVGPIKLEAFNDSFNCKTQQLSSYCHHCMRMDRHEHNRCPHIRREAS
ncbi:unnamed protein product [Absidia cylindrospora]